MKKLLILITAVASTVGAYAQGELIFNNVTANRITNSVTGVAWASGPNSLVAVYGAAGGGQSEASLTIQLGCVTNLFAAGFFQGNTRATSLPVGLATLQIRAWGSANAAYPSYEAAFAGAFGGDSTVVLGSSAPFNHTLVANGVPGNPTGSGFQRFAVNPVPEPSSIALGLLGLGAVALFRRRK